MMRAEFKRDILSLAAGALAKPVLNRLRDRVDNRRYNGAALLGLRGIVVKSHGSADAYAFGFALQRAREAMHNGLLAGTTSAIYPLRHRFQYAAAHTATRSETRPGGEHC